MKKLNYRYIKAIILVAVPVLLFALLHPLMHERISRSATLSLAQEIEQDRPNLEKLQILISRGARVDALSEKGFSALHTAACLHQKNWQRPDVLRLLLRANPNVNVKTQWGDTPLMCAAGEGFPDEVELLLRSGADVNARDNRKGETALGQALAVMKYPARTRDPKFIKVVRLLKAAGAKE